MIGQLCAIARNAFTESIRQPIFIVMLLVIGGLLVLNLPLSTYTFDDDNKLMTDLGLSTIILGGLILSAMAATGIVSREIETRTVLTVISKPVPRPILIIGKYLGVAGALTLAMWIWGVVFLLTVRHGVLQTASQKMDGPVVTFGCWSVGIALLVAGGANYLFGRHFGATLARWLAGLLTLAYLLVLLVGKRWVVQPPTTDLNGQMLAALLLLCEAVWLLAAVAVAASTRLGQGPTLLIAAIVFFLGLCSDYAFGRSAAGSAWAGTMYAIVPNLQFLWLADALTQGHRVDARYLLLTSSYTLLLVIVALAVAVALFQRRQTS